MQLMPVVSWRGLVASARHVLAGVVYSGALSHKVRLQADLVAFLLHEACRVRPLASASPPDRAPEYSAPV